MRSHGRPAGPCEPWAYWRASLAAVVLVTATGCTSTGRSHGDDDPGDASGSGGSATPADAATPTPPDESQRLPERQAPLQGAYAVPFAGWGDTPPEVAHLRAHITLPAGFEVDDGSTMVESGAGLLTERCRLGFWMVDRVASNFCAGGDDFTDPGPKVADLASALAAQPRLSGTDPVPVTIGRYNGLYVELTRPVAECPGTVLWFAPRIKHTAYLDRFGGPGDVAGFWILDVEGDRVVINTIHPTDASDEQIAELTNVVESATLVR